MKLFKQFSVSLVALAAATAATAATQPFVTPVSSTITVDAVALNSSLAGYSIAAIGNASWNSATGVLNLPIQTLTTSSNPGPLNIEYGDTSGLKFTKTLNPTITLQNFSFDLATNELSGDLIVGNVLFPTLKIENQSVLKALNVESVFGGVDGSSVANSGTARPLDLRASNFVLSDSFVEYLNLREINPDSVAFVAGMFTQISVTTVPEPSTYALMGLGLVGMGLMAKRKRAA